MTAQPDYFFRYLDIRGRGEPIRWLLKACDAKYKEERIAFADWPKMKPEFEWGVTPVLEVGGVPLHQTMSISRYLAHSHNMVPKDLFEQAKLDEIAESVHELSGLLGAAFRARLMKGDDKIPELLSIAMEKSLFVLSLVEKYVTKEGWIHSKVMTWCDIVTASYLDLLGLHMPDLLEKTPKLQNLLKNVQMIPAIQSWRNSRPELNPFEVPFV